MQLVRLIGSLNHGIGALRASMGHRGFGYIIALSAIVTLVGVAEMYAFAFTLLQLPSPTDTSANSDVRQLAVSHILQPLVKIALLGDTGRLVRVA